MFFFDFVYWEEFNFEKCVGSGTIRNIHVLIGRNLISRSLCLGLGGDNLIDGFLLLRCLSDFGV